MCVTVLFVLTPWLPLPGLNSLYQKRKKIQPKSSWGLHNKSSLFHPSLRDHACEVLEYWDNKAWNTAATFTQTGNKCFISLKEQVEARKDSAHNVSQQELEHSGPLTGREIGSLSVSEGCLSSVDPCTHQRPKTISQTCSGNNPFVYSCHQLATSDVPQMSPDSFLLMALTRKKPSKVWLLSKRKKIQKLLSMKVQKSNASIVKPSVLEKSELATHMGPQATDNCSSPGWGTLSRCNNVHLW